MEPTIYLFFKGNCFEAMTRYAEVLGGEIGSVLVGETFVADGAGGVCALSGAMSEYGAWRAGGAEHENAEELLDLAKEHAERLAVRAAGNTQPLPPPAEQPALGALIAAPVVRCALVCASLPPLDATLYPFEHGALLAQPRLGAVWLPFSGHGAPASVTLHDDGAAAPRSPSRPQPRSVSRRCALGNGVRAATFRREVPPTGRRRRAPVGRGARLEGLRQPSAPHRSSRAAPRSRLRSATRRLAPRRPPRPLSSNQSPGTPRARSVFGLSARGRPFRARFFAAARRTGPVGVQRRALRLSGPPAAALGGQNLVRLH